MAHFPMFGNFQCNFCHSLRSFLLGNTKSTFAVAQIQALDKLLFSLQRASFGGGFSVWTGISTLKRAKISDLFRASCFGFRIFPLCALCSNSSSTIFPSKWG